MQAEEVADLHRSCLPSYRLKSMVPKGMIPKQMTKKKTTLMPGHPGEGRIGSGMERSVSALVGEQLLDHPEREVQRAKGSAERHDVGDESHHVSFLIRVVY